ncbi:MAG TPA: T9SS type A sorting domain-containing protein [Candidatus Cloacimonadota bacterium]|nr:T9SS type A sorting domain-containing protein [Candidatus Cloacimonadota bacterium]HPT71733.1 T9SS type A sorting domain-containing protein [Candidatus Cloacimonadota bacterium]
MKFKFLFLSLIFLFTNIYLFAILHVTTERAIDFGSKSLENVIALSDGHFVSFSGYDVDVFTIEGNSLNYCQKLHSNQYYGSAVTCGVDTILAVTRQNRLDVYIYDTQNGLSLIRNYTVDEIDSYAEPYWDSVLTEDVLITDEFIDNGDLNTSCCQSIYSLSGVEEPILKSRAYINPNNRFSGITHQNNLYYYFGCNGGFYASSTLTNQPTAINSLDVEGNKILACKVLGGDLYVISIDASSQRWLSKLRTTIVGNVDSGSAEFIVEKTWTQQLENLDWPEISDVIDGYVYITMGNNSENCIVKKYAFSTSSEWQNISTHSYSYSYLHLVPTQNGFLAVGGDYALLLNNFLNIQAIVLANNEYWWCYHVFLNRYLILDDGDWFKLYDLDTECFLNFQTPDLYQNYTYYYGENKILFIGDQIQVVTLGNEGITNILSFPNVDDLYHGSVLGDKLLLYGDDGISKHLFLYQIIGNSISLLHDEVSDHFMFMMQFYDSNHFIVNTQNMDTGLWTMSFYRIESDNSFTLINTFQTTDSRICVDRTKVSTGTFGGVVIDVSQPDTPVELTHITQIGNGFDMTFNGHTNYLLRSYNNSILLDENFQYIDYLPLFHPLFLDGNRILLPGPTSAVIVTVDEIVANPPDEEIPVNTITQVLTNYPNPFNPTTTISFNMSKPSQVKLSVYNIRGQKVSQLLDEKMAIGQHKVVWDGKDEHHKAVASGIYFTRLEILGKNVTKKMILLK